MFRSIFILVNSVYFVVRESLRNIRRHNDIKSKLRKNSLYKF